MKYPKTLNVKVENIFGDQDVQITLYSGLTIFVGTNASGKTQTLKKIRDIMRNEVGSNKVRSLSSNRIGNMEQYRSKTNQYSYTIDDYTLGDQATKRARLQIELQVEISLQWTNERMFLLRYPKDCRCCLIEIFLFAGMLDK